MILVSRSCPRYSRKSTSFRSAMLPSDTNFEKPMLMDRAQSRMAVAMAPDCDSMPTSYWNGAVSAKVAFIPIEVLMTPTEFGPTRRTPWRRASSTSSRSARAPSLPVSRKPAVMMTTARTPFSQHSRRTSRTAAAGTVRIARSGVSGRSSTDGYVGRPRIRPGFGFTAYSSPR